MGLVPPHRPSLPPVPLTIDRHESRCAVLNSPRADGGGWAGLVGLSITERDAPTRAERERSDLAHAWSAG
jgi:hypothetical protein